MRRLRVEVTERGETGPVAMVSAQAAGSGGAEIVLTLSAEARVDVTIVNIAGRVVRRLATDRSLPAGVTRMAWNGGSDAGTTVPAGRYLVRVRAAAQGGRASTALTGLQVRR